MYDLRLGAEQIEIRDTVRNFVDQMVRPVALKSGRLEGGLPPLPFELLDQLSQMGMRSLAMPESMGGAGADRLTECVVAEELGAGDPDSAMEFAHSWSLARVLFGSIMTQEQRERFLPGFMADDRAHLAFVGAEKNERAAWQYPLPGAFTARAGLTAVPQPKGAWLVNGTSGLVQNGPIAKLVIGLAETCNTAAEILFVGEGDFPGLTVRDALPSRLKKMAL